MKKSITKVMAILLTLVLAFSFAACNSQANNQSTSTNENSSNDNTQKIKIGIVQIVEHPSLNTIREAFISELAKEGYVDGQNITIDYQNAQNDQTNLKTICQKFSSGNYDLIVAIATPSAQAAVGETSTIPIIFSACTDPVASGIVDNLEKPGKNVTGTSDAVSAEKIMELAKKITPNIKTIGALYSSGETNSISVINDLKAYAEKNGMTVVDATVTNASEVQQAVTSLVGKVDAIFSPIDNTVASAMPIVTEAANAAKIPVYVGADSMVADGGLATYGINYTVLGQETAKMAVEVLKGTSPGEIPVKLMTDMDIYVNSTTAAALGITIPDDVMSKAKDLKK